MQAGDGCSRLDGSADLLRALVGLAKCDGQVLGAISIEQLNFVHDLTGGFALCTGQINHSTLCFSLKELLKLLQVQLLRTTQYIAIHERKSACPVHPRIRRIWDLTRVDKSYIHSCQCVCQVPYYACPIKCKELGYMSCQVPLSAKTNNPGDGVRPDLALQSRAKSRLCFGLGWSLKEAPGPSPGVWLAFLLSLGEVKHEITGCSASIIVI